MKENWLCPGEKCKHYEATDKKRSCYYEPGCWKGFADMVILLPVLPFRREK